jgi:hypothetical protein
MYTMIYDVISIDINSEYLGFAAVLDTPVGI